MKTFVAASTLIRDQLHADNAKKAAEIDDLQQFVNRFSANASKAKQATSRAKRMDKIKLDEVKPSSRVAPYITLKATSKAAPSGAG